MRAVPLVETQLTIRFYERFSFCPCCGEKYGDRDFDSSDVLFLCARCGHRFYQNSIPSSTAVIPEKNCPSRILLLTRATEPNRGKLALPGGILRYGENPAEGAKREAKEETTLDVTVQRLLCETLVDYKYQGASVSVLELAFLTQPVDAEVHAVRTSEASALAYYDVGELLQGAAPFAFPEQRRVLQHYKDHAMNLFVA